MFYCNPKCLNGGKCVGLLNGTKCECPVSYFGETCEKSKCDNVKCENNGVCRLNNTTKEGYMCECVEDFSGQFCETNLSNFKIILNIFLFIFISIKTLVFKKTTVETTINANG